MWHMHTWGRPPHYQWTGSPNPRVNSFFQSGPPPPVLGYQNLGYATMPTLPVHAYTIPSIPFALAPALHAIPRCYGSNGTARFEVLPYGSAKPWEKPGVYKGRHYEISSNMSCREFLRRFGGHNWNVAVTEYIHAGDFQWRRGRTMHYQDPKIDLPISELGWGPTRDSKNPVLVVVHAR